MKRFTLEETHALSLEILKDIHRFCKENGIRYFAFYGTLLGAVRHKGFIPWDDDIDLMMPREDYERFRAIYKSDKYRFISRENSDQVYVAFGRVVDMASSRCIINLPWHSDKEESGMFVDIFTLDSVPDDIQSYYNLYDILDEMRDRQIKARRRLAKPYPELGLKERLKIVRRRLFHKSRVNPADIAKQMQDLVALTAQIPSVHAAQMTLPVFRKAYFLKSDFEKLIEVPFEDTTIMIPAEYDKLLTAIYGDYMTPPPVEKRKPELDDFGGIYWKSRS